MRSLILIGLASTLGALEIAQLPTEVTIDPKEILEGKEHEVFNTGYVTVRMQKYGYLDAKAIVQDGKMTAIPGARYTIRSLTIKGMVPERRACEIPLTPENTQLLQAIFAGSDWSRSISAEDHAIHYTLTAK